MSGCGGRGDYVGGGSRAELVVLAIVVVMVIEIVVEVMFCSLELYDFYHMHMWLQC